LAHHPLRVYVMGERAIAREHATAEDIEAMARLTEEALKAGAVGFTTSRTDQHKTLAGDLVPGRYAEHEELLAIGRAMGRAIRRTTSRRRRAASPPWRSARALPRPSSATTIWSAAMAGGWCISPSPTMSMATSRWCGN